MRDLLESVGSGSTINLSILDFKQLSVPMMLLILATINLSILDFK